jgi:hypothetical protein
MLYPAERRVPAIEKRRAKSRSLRQRQAPLPTFLPRDDDFFIAPALRPTV